MDVPASADGLQTERHSATHNGYENRMFLSRYLFLARTMTFLTQ